jgi:hypothetical protein
MFFMVVIVDCGGVQRKCGSDLCFLVIRGPTAARERRSQSRSKNQYSSSVEWISRLQRGSEWAVASAALLYIAAVLGTLITYCRTSRIPLASWKTRCLFGSLELLQKSREGGRRAFRFWKRLTNYFLTPPIRQLRLFSDASLRERQKLHILTSCAMCVIDVHISDLSLKVVEWLNFICCLWSKNSTSQGWYIKLAFYV